MRCSSCGMDGNTGPRCDRCGVALSPQAQALSLPQQRAPSVASLRLELLAVPLALVAAALLVSTGPGSFLVQASAEMELHELGHATALWLASRPAVPLPMVTLSAGEGRSVITFVLVSLAIAALFWRARREQLPELAGLSAALALGLVGCTLFLSGERLDLWVKFAGAGGELWLGALLLLAFHRRLPASWRWAQARWFFLAWGALSFAAATGRWWRGEIPWGSFWGGDGDMDILRDHGWTEPEIVHAYRTVLVLCALALAADLGFRAWAARPQGGARR